MGYDEEGGIGQQVGEAVDDKSPDKVTILGGKTYRSYNALWQALQDQYPDAEPALQVLDKDAYNAITFQTLDGTAFNKPNLFADSHFWQERFHSFVMNEDYLLAAVRYVELNPVKAKLCELPECWPWSSAEAHLKGCDDQVVEVAPMLEHIADWGSYLSQNQSEEERVEIRRFSASGRPAGNEGFIDSLEKLTGRELRKLKPGPKPRIK